MSHSLQTNPPNFHDQELDKTVLKLALFIAVAILFQDLAIELGLGSHLVQILLPTGCVAIYNGIVLRNIYPRAASVVEQAGIGLVFLTFNMLVASVVPKGIVWWLPVLCFGIFNLPLVMAVPSRVAALLRFI